MSFVRKFRVSVGSTLRQFLYGPREFLLRLRKRNRETDSINYGTVGSDHSLTEGNGDGDVERLMNIIKVSRINR